MSATHFIALAGNPNSGKTTAFNRYTGARQHVGNYPGITVEKKEGTAHVNGVPVTLVDLPGTYSLTAYSMEEVVARRVLAEDRPGAVINVINAGVLERNLYLSVQLLEMGMPVVLALNMMDEARSQGITIDTARLESIMGVSAVPTVARTGEGLDKALQYAVKLAESRQNSTREALEISYGADIDAALQTMIPIVAEARLLTDKYPARWVALKFLEKDEEILRQAQAAAASVSAQLLIIVEKVTKHLASTLKTYPEAVIADYRYGYIASVLRQGVVSGADELKSRIAYSDKVDAVLTNQFLGPLILAIVLFAIYHITFTLGQYPADWLTDLFGLLKEYAEANMEEGFLRSLIASGIIDGAGGVMGFVPLIAVMFLLISFLEDSGYMARVSYMLDRIFRFFGLHGASVMPFIISGGLGGGCAIPGIMATRTLRSPRERLATILTAPFMSCGAKLPVFLLLVSVFFEDNKTLIMVLITLTGWAAALIVARVLRSTIIQGEATPFVMELPPYRMPTLRGIIIHTWERIWNYIQKAGTIILAISILLWAGMTFPELSAERVAEFSQKKAVVEAKIEALTAAESGKDAEKDAGAEADKEGAKEAAAEASKNKEEAKEGEAEEAVSPAMQALKDELTAVGNAQSEEALKNSVAGRIGIMFEPVSAPAGFDWRTNIALFAGIAAKEVVVSTLGTAYSLGAVDAEDSASLEESIKADPHWTVANGVALLLFTLLYSPCFVSLAVIRSETGKWRWMFFSLFFNLVFAYGIAVAANQTIKAFFL